MRVRISHHKSAAINRNASITPYLHAAKSQPVGRQAMHREGILRRRFLTVLLGEIANRW
jgi:hypothetical protein